MHQHLLVSYMCFVPSSFLMAEWTSHIDQSLDTAFSQGEGKPAYFSLCELSHSVPLTFPSCYTACWVPFLCVGVPSFILSPHAPGNRRKLEFIDRTEEGFFYEMQTERERDRKVKLSSLALLITFHSFVDKMNILHILQAVLPWVVFLYCSTNLFNSFSLNTKL